MRPAAAACAAVGRARAEAGRRPRHVVLFAAVLGVLAGPVSTAAVVAATVLCGSVAPAAPLAIGAASTAAVMGAFGSARAQAIDHGPLERLRGSILRGRATVLEPPRRRPRGV